MHFNVSVPIASRGLAMEPEICYTDNAKVNNATASFGNTALYPK